MKREVLIVGGGPSGAVAGIHLLKNKFKVTLFEKGNKNRNKICGEGLTPESQNILKIVNLYDKVKKFALEVNEMTVFDLSNRPISLKNKYLTLERSMLDLLLREEVEELGGSIIYNSTIVDWFKNRKSVTVEDTSGKKYEGDVLVLATGADNSLSKKGNWITTPYTAVAIRAYGKNTTNCKTLEFYMHRKLFPAYGWVFPLPNNRINIGVYTHKDSGPTRDVSKLMKIFYDVLAERYSSSFELLSPLQGWTLQTGLHGKNISDDRVLLVGENIASTYNLSGEGIGPAMKSGFLAAKTIIEADGIFTKSSLCKYEIMIQKELGPMHFGYNKLMKLFKYKPFFTVATWILRRSKRARIMVEEIIDEKITFKKVFRLQSLIGHIFA